MYDSRKYVFECFKITVTKNNAVFRSQSLFTRVFSLFNLLKPNDIYICRTEALTYRRYILNIYSTNIRTEYFKHAA